MTSQTFTFSVDMTCEGCSNAVKKVLGKLEGQGIESFDIDLKGKKVIVKSTLSSNEVLEVLKKTGKATSLLGEAN